MKAMTTITDSNVLWLGRNRKTTVQEARINRMNLNSRISDTTICSSGKTPANWIMRRRFFSPNPPFTGDYIGLFIT